MQFARTVNGKFYIIFTVLLVYNFSTYVGYGAVNGTIGTDRHQLIFHHVNTIFVGDAPYCQDISKIEQALAKFIGQHTLNYSFENNYLLLNHNNQKLYFMLIKKK